MAVMLRTPKWLTESMNTIMRNDLIYSKMLKVREHQKSYTKRTQRFKDTASAVMNSYMTLLKCYTELYHWSRLKRVTLTTLCSSTDGFWGWVGPLHKVAEIWAVVTWGRKEEERLLPKAHYLVVLHRSECIHLPRTAEEDKPNLEISASKDNVKHTQTHTQSSVVDSVHTSSTIRSL